MFLESGSGIGLVSTRIHLATRVLQTKTVWLAYRVDRTGIGSMASLMFSIHGVNLIRITMLNVVLWVGDLVTISQTAYVIQISISFAKNEVIYFVIFFNSFVK